MPLTVPDETPEDPLAVAQAEADRSFDDGSVSEFILSGNGSLFLIRRCSVDDDGEVNEYVHPLAEPDVISITH